jgi:genome maintenance exonuclease 1
MFNHVKLDREVPKLKQINEDGTRYYSTPEGNKYPSITTVLAEYSRKGIMEWRERVGAEQANKIAGKASTRGTKLHKVCEQYLNNDELEFKTPFERSFFESLKPQLSRIDNIYAQELRMYSDHLRIAGTVDCVAEFDGKLSVIDFKSASKPKDKDYIENYFMQCSAYAIMFEEIFKIPISQIVIAIAVEEDDPQIFVEKRDKYVKRLLYYRDLYEKKH